MDFDHPSNVVISLVSVIALAGGFIVRLTTGQDWQTSILWGLGVSVSVFLAWALSREIEPGKDLPSYFTIAITLIAVFFYYPPNFLGLIWLMLALRMVNRSTGLKARWQDSVLITFVSGVLIWFGYWQFTLMGALVFLFDAWLREKHPRQYWFAIIHVIMFVVVFITNTRPPSLYLPSVQVIIPVVIVSVLMVVTTLVQRETGAVDDVHQNQLRLKRIQATRLLALFIGLIVTFWNGDPGFRRLMPLWAALAGSAVYRFFLMTGFRDTVSDTE